MLEKIKLLNDFFERYGVCITSQDTSKKTFGIIKRVTNLNAEYDDRTLTRSGFMKKCEYLIISKADNEVLLEDSIVYINGLCYKIINCEAKFIGEAPIYRRSYAYRIREVSDGSNRQS